MRGILIRVGIIGAIVIGAFILRPFISGSAGDLKVGDCFDPPTTLGVTVKDVQHHPCTDAHGAEVVFVGNHPSSATYPTDDEFDQYFLDTCVPAYLAYTGIDLLTTTDETGTMDYFSPTSEGWGKGDRTVICYATRTDGTSTTGTVKKG
jgi:hypothetical protein